MNLVEIQEFFGWCTVIHFSILVFTTLLLVGFQKNIAKIHSKMMNIDMQEMPRIYMNYLAYYKLGIFIFALVPYISLKVMG